MEQPKQELLIIKLPTKTPALLIKGLYNQLEKRAVWEELTFLAKEHKLQPPENTGSAMNPDGTSKKSNKGLFLDEIYVKRELSNILEVNRNIFDVELMDQVSQHGDLFKYLKKSNHDSTLLSYYERSDHYKPHEDQAVLTAITYVWKEPKQFNGGILSFTEEGYEVHGVNSFDMILFPSFMTHEVSEVTLKDNVPEWQCNGRFAISQFIKV